MYAMSDGCALGSSTSLTAGASTSSSTITVCSEHGGQQGSESHAARRQSTAFQPAGQPQPASHNRPAPSPTPNADLHGHGWRGQPRCAGAMQRCGDQHRGAAILQIDLQAVVGVARVAGHVGACAGWRWCGGGEWLSQQQAPGAGMGACQGADSRASLGRVWAAHNARRAALWQPASQPYTHLQPSGWPALR